MITYSKTNFSYWSNHFQKNKQGRKEPQWDLEIKLEPHLLKVLTPSIEQFQLGDGGGPASLIAWNKETFRSSSPQMQELVDAWFAEEKEHSRLLGKLVERLGGKIITTHWSFELFCLLRKILGVRFELIILLCTEIVSTIYYRLLHKYIDDKPFKDTSLLILRDEAGHIAFHRNRLVQAGIDKVTSYGVIYNVFMHLCTFGAGTVLWVSHGKTLRTIGATTYEFYRGIKIELDQFLQKLDQEIQLKSSYRDNL